MVSSMLESPPGVQFVAFHHSCTFHGFRKIIASYVADSFCIRRKALILLSKFWPCFYNSRPAVRRFVTHCVVPEFHIAPLVSVRVHALTYMQHVCHCFYYPISTTPGVYLIRYTLCIVVGHTSSLVQMTQVVFLVIQKVCHLYRPIPCIPLFERPYFPYPLQTPVVCSM